MWIARVIGPDGKSAEVSVFQRSAELPSSRLALGVVRERFRELPAAITDSELLGYLEAEANEHDQTGASVSRRAVQELSTNAIAELRNREDKELIRVIGRHFHLRTLVILPVTGSEAEVELTYEFDEKEKVLDGSPFTGSYTLDWRAYLGRGTAIIDGRTGPSNFSGTAPIRLKFVVRGLPRVPGLLVGYVLRQTGRLLDISFPRDPTFPSRRQQAELDHKALANQIPSVDAVAGITRPMIAIFIHGTHSHGLESLKDLAPLQPGQCSLFRYEHDTFLPVSSNANELAQIIQRYFSTPNLTLIAHSRGGLVARLTKLVLEKMKYPSPIRVMTFGTPHCGTPLINNLQQNVSLLFRLGKLGILGLPSLTPLNYVLSCLTNVRVIPEGVSFMETGSHGLETLNLLDDPTNTECWGAVFDPRNPKGGYGVVLDGILSGVLYGADNDLIVPTTSALGFGRPRQVLDCGHSGYFREPLVRGEINQACPGVLQ